MSAFGYTPSDSQVPDGSLFRIAIIATEWHRAVVDKLLDAALQTLQSAGVQPHNIVEYRVPGAFEIPVLAASLARSKKFQAVITLGCVIRGDTPHFDYVAGPVSYALQSIQLETEVPVLFGVLTTDTLQQAEARSGGTHGNKGKDAAVAALVMAALLKSVQSNNY